jgi:hypothetical protein
MELASPASPESNPKYGEWVKFEMPCPKCGTILKHWESKDRLWEDNSLEYWEVNNFYTECDNCKSFIEFNIKKPFISIDSYNMTVVSPIVSP